MGVMCGFCAEKVTGAWSFTSFFWGGGGVRVVLSCFRSANKYIP